MEIDDAYLGGEIQGGKAGRGSPNKVEFVAAVQTTESGEPVLGCLSKRTFTKESIKEFAAKSPAAPATLVSNGLGCFTAVLALASCTSPTSLAAALSAPSIRRFWPSTPCWAT